jgi:hypothetical protein
MNAVATLSTSRLPMEEIRERRKAVEDILKKLMQKDVHYGVIPGTQKPTLLKPGAEMILSTFQLAPEFEVIDRSTADEIRYVIKSRVTHYPTGVVMGQGLGECSSSEAKYKWRKAVSEAEWDAAQESRRRLKYEYGDQVTKQIRTEIADVANTILKMGKKRSLTDVTLTVTACSDMFEQDLDERTDESPDLGGRQEQRTAEPLQNPAAATVTGVTSRQFKSKNGPRTAYNVETNVGTFETIKEDLAAQARGLIGQPASLTWHKDQWGMKIDGLVVPMNAPQRRADYVAVQGEPGKW